MSESPPVLAKEVDQRLSNDAVALARRRVDVLSVEDLLNSEVEPHGLFEFAGTRILGAPLRRERPVESLQKVDFGFTEPYPGCRRAIIVRHELNCKAGGIITGDTITRRRAAS